MAVQNRRPENRYLQKFLVSSEVGEFLEQDLVKMVWLQSVACLCDFVRLGAGLNHPVLKTETTEFGKELDGV